MRGLAVPLIALAVLLALPALLTPYTQDLVVRIAIYAIFALSLELLVGMTGLVSLGHAAFLGIGAYATVLVSGDSAASLLKVLVISVTAAAAYALFVGALSLRTRGVYFIMVTLAFAQMAYFVAHDTKLGGGSDGIFLYVKPVLEFGGATLINLDDRRSFYYLVLACLALTYGLLALLLRSRFGHALAGIRVNEQRMRAAGFRTYGYKLAAFVLAGALAGLAGFLIAVRDGFVNPEMLAWQESGTVLLMLILGGLGHLRGAVLGALVFTYALLAALQRSRFGHALAGIRVNEQRMRAAGFRTYGYKLAAFVIAGALAGLAGFLVASRDGVVNPELLAWHNSGEVLLMIILGGLGHLRGAVIGAFAYALLQELFKSDAIFGAFAKHWLLAMGLTIIVSVALLPRGLIGVADRLKARRSPEPVQAT